MSAVISHNTFWLACRAGCVNDVKGVGRRDCRGVDRFCGGLHLCPVQVPPGEQLCGELLALQNDGVLRFVLGKL